MKSAGRMPWSARKFSPGHDRKGYAAQSSLYGPSGVGKTTLAHVIAHATHSRFVKVNAVTAGTAELRKVIQEARDAIQMYQKRTILFIDEIHRFNKSQQDVLLPYVEDGTVILIGATTENPYLK